MIPMTRGEDYRHLHDETSRHLRVFPAKGSSRATFTLYEDDGISMRYREGGTCRGRARSRDVFERYRAWSARDGALALPVTTITVELPVSERRPLTLRGEGVRWWQR